MPTLQLDMPVVDPHPVTRTIKALRVQQPIGEIYLAMMDHHLVKKVTSFDVRRVLSETRDVEAYLGIQRPLNKRRVADLQRYVNFADATFPTSIILAIDDSDFVSFDEATGDLTLSNMRPGNADPDIAFSSLCRVLDGQHRIEGLREFHGEKFDVMVALFVGIDISDQAYIFATVNLEQTKVNKSLAFDLFDLAKTRSPFKTCHNVAIGLDTVEGSPFYRRIKRLGAATAGREFETITQATFVDGLMKYISRDPKKDRDVLLRGQTLSRVSADVLKDVPLRNLFIDGEDVLIGRIVQSYFEAVKKKWPTAWNQTGEGYMLNRTNGFRALMSIFGQVYRDCVRPGEFAAPEKFLERFRRSTLKDEDFTTRRFKPGTSGESDLRHSLLRDMFG